MAMSTKQDDDDGVMSEINVTPLVDVMLVLLIIFLITVPVAKANRPVVLPKVTNIETHSKPENVVLVVENTGEISREGHVYAGISELKEYIRSRAVEVPQPEVHIRADRDTRYAYVGRVLMAVQVSGMVKVRFLSEPQLPGT
jgi:biopolymer transport protein ExbD